MSFWKFLFLFLAQKSLIGPCTFKPHPFNDNKMIWIHLSIHGCHGVNWLSIRESIVHFVMVFKCRSSPYYTLNTLVTISIWIWLGWRLWLWLILWTKIFRRIKITTKFTLGWERRITRWTRWLEKMGIATRCFKWLIIISKLLHSNLIQIHHWPLIFLPQHV